MKHEMHPVVSKRKLKKVHKTLLTIPDEILEEVGIEVMSEKGFEKAAEDKIEDVAKKKGKHKMMKTLLGMK